MRSVSSRPTGRGIAFVALIIGTAFLWAGVLSVSPQLHERLHSGAGIEHSCAVTFVGSGQFHHSTPAPLVSRQVPENLLSKIPALTPHWIQSLFLGASIFEHAPPART